MVVSLLEQPEKLTLNSEQTEQWKEYWKARKFFLYFLQNFVKIQDRTKEQTVKWESWPYLIWLAQVFLQEKLIVIIKARQLGISWLVCAYCYWKAKFHDNVKVLFLSQGEDEAFDLIAKCVFIDNNLPIWMQSPRSPDQRGFIGFPSTSSEIKALPSTEKAGRSTDATIVVPDEWEYHPYAEANFAALKPTIDAGGQFIGLTTANKLVSINKSFPKNLFIKAKSGNSNFFPIFLPYHLRPGRTQEWREELKKDMPLYQIEQEYPVTEQDALDVLREYRVFDEKALEDMEHHLTETADQDDIDTHNGIIRIYKLPIVGERYAVFTDPSDGYDPFHTVVGNLRTGEGVAEASGKLTADMCAKIHDELVRAYNAHNSFEVNAQAGGKFQEVIKNLDTPNIIPRYSPDGKIVPDKVGWYTTPQHRRNMIWNLEEAIRTRDIISHFDLTVNQFRGFIRPEGQEPQITSGMHDDAIMAWAGFCSIRKYIPLGGMKVESFKYRD